MKASNAEFSDERKHVKISLTPLTTIAQSTRSKNSALRGKRRCREEREKKVAQKGVKSMRGQPEMYDELKKIVTVSLTPTAVAGLDQFARNRSISRSELVERIGRQVIKIVNDLVHE